MSEGNKILRIKEVDLEALQKDYEVGILSLRELAAKHSMCPKNGYMQIKRHADKEGWVQDIGAKIQAKAEAKLAKLAVPEEKRQAPRLADSTIIEANAEAIVQVRLRHRRDIGGGVALTLKMMQELEHHTDNQELLEALGEAMYNPDPKTGRDKLNEIYQAVISLPERIKSNKALSETIKNYIGLEREAYGLKTDDGSSGLPKVRVKDFTGKGSAPA